ncbi:MAG TPA: EthD domain-containing protein, partial [Steroidobacteraceae bacterium]|nr:EthD domain-containing protein [Steroidobacteraceae bacterium]
MIKAIGMMKRKPGVSREDFIRHYEEVHAPLAQKLFGFSRYVRNYPVPVPGGGEPPFDVITEFWFENKVAHARAMAFNASPEAQVIREDEELFMDTSKTVGFL